MNWKYTAITSENDLVQHYALVYIPNHLFNDVNNRHAIREILSVFSGWTLIIFSHHLIEVVPPIERLLEDEGKKLKITIGLVKQVHVNELKDTKKKEDRMPLIARYLKLENLPLPTNEVSDQDIGTLIGIITQYITVYRPDIQKFFGSDNLRKVSTNINLRGAPGPVAAHIILRLNEPPYRTDSTGGHTLLGEFLCGLVGEEDFPPSEGEKVKGIIRKYKLSPSSCGCYNL